MNIKKVAVVGSGQMGRGIAQVIAQTGYDVCLWDAQPGAAEAAKNFIAKMLDKAIEKGKLDAASKDKTLSKVKVCSELADAVQGVDLVIEAIVENLDVKVSLFKQIHQKNGSAIIASNTSSISITKMAALSNVGEKFVGIHFMNPVPIMKLVEGIKGLQTSEVVLKTAKEFVESLGKVWVEGRDYPGFIVNRILMPMINEGAFALMEGLASAKDIDTAMKLGCNLPMGPLELADFIGLDTCVNIMNVLYEGHGNQKFAPCPLLKSYVDAGRLGRKTGRGFFDY